MAGDRRELSSRYKKRDWHFDEDAGEYYPISDHFGDRYIYRAKPYAHRELEYFQLVKEFRQTRLTCFISWIGLIISLKFFDDAIHHHPSTMMELPIAIFLLWPFGFAAFGSTLLLIYQLAISLPLTRRKIGPPPMTPFGRQEVEDEDAYGAGGRLTGDDLMQAARGHKRHPGSTRMEETFDDEW